MRIIAGTLGGRRFDVPRGSTARPTAERVRESLFSILQGRLPGARVADVFAGTGALGLEALSRGAARVAFCDKDGKALRHIGELLARFGVTEDRYTLEGGDALTALSRWKARGLAFDIVFVDPPYREGLYEPALTGLAPLVVPGGLAVAEHERRSPLGDLPGWRVTDRRDYGTTTLTFLTREDTNASVDLSRVL